MRRRRICTIRSCDRYVCGQGFCSMHYQRLRAWGHTGSADTLRPRGVLDQIATKVLIGDGCWEWTGARKPDGYGFLNVGGKPKPAHRVMYELLVELIPEGLELDHLCRNHSCVRPDHLEPVTHLENMRRGQWATATHCTNGHEWNEDSIYWRRDGKYPSRQCRVCARIRDRRRA